MSLATSLPTRQEFVRVVQVDVLGHLFAYTKVAQPAATCYQSMCFKILHDLVQAGSGIVCCSGKGRVFQMCISRSYSHNCEVCYVFKSPLKYMVS